MEPRQSLFCLKIASTDVISRPVTKEELEAYIKEQNIGGTVYACYLVPLCEVELHIPWAKAAETLNERPDSNSGNPETSSLRERESPNGEMRTAVTSGLGLPGDSGTGRHSGTVSGDGGAGVQELLVLSAGHK